jgi:hypothetical protein
MHPIVRIDQSRPLRLSASTSSGDWFCLFLHIAYGRFAAMAYIHRITASWPWPAGEASPLAPIRTKTKTKKTAARASTPRPCLGTAAYPPTSPPCQHFPNLPRLHSTLHITRSTAPPPGQTPLQHPPQLRNQPPLENHPPLPLLGRSTRRPRKPTTFVVARNSKIAAVHRSSPNSCAIDVFLAVRFPSVALRTARHMVIR